MNRSQNIMKICIMVVLLLLAIIGDAHITQLVENVLLAVQTSSDKFSKKYASDTFNKNE